MKNPTQRTFVFKSFFALFMLCICGGGNLIYGQCDPSNYYDFEEWGENIKFDCETNTNNNCEVLPSLLPEPSDYVTEPGSNEMLPDLIISAWAMSNPNLNDVPGYVFQNNIDEIPAGKENMYNTFNGTYLLGINTTMTNVGLGPFEAERTNELWCCGDWETCREEWLLENPGSTGLTDLELFNYCCEPLTSGICTSEKPYTLEKIKQHIYCKDCESGEDIGTTAITQNPDAVTATETPFPMLGLSHAEHGDHFHINDYVEVSLRKRPASSSPNYNEPLEWEVVGTSKKISFCLSNGFECICQEPFYGLVLPSP